MDTIFIPSKNTCFELQEDFQVTVNTHSGNLLDRIGISYKWVYQYNADAAHYYYPEIHEYSKLNDVITKKLLQIDPAFRNNYYGRMKTTDSRAEPLLKKQREMNVSLQDIGQKRYSDPRTHANIGVTLPAKTILKIDGFNSNRRGESIKVSILSVPSLPKYQLPSLNGVIPNKELLEKAKLKINKKIGFTKTGTPSAICSLESNDITVFNGVKLIEVKVVKEEKVKKE